MSLNWPQLHNSLYTARSLAGLVSRCGLIKLGALLSIQQLYARYQQGNDVLTIHQLCEPGVDLAACSQEERWMHRYCYPVDVLFTGACGTRSGPSPPTTNLRS